MKKLFILIYSCLVLLMAWTAFGYPPVPIVHWGSLSETQIPDTDDTYDLGSSSYEWKDIYVDGVGYFDTIQTQSLTVDNGATTAGFMYFKEDSSNGTNTVQLIGPSSTANVVQTLQASTGTVLITGTSVGREFSSTAMTNGDTQTAFSEANMLASKYLTNQGETVELDVILVAVSYPISGVISNDEALVIEICPPSGEILYLDGVALDANDCVDSDGVVGSLASYLRFQDGDAAWHYHILSTTGAWTDTGATDQELT